jgi:hypothetical protein
MLQDAWSEDGCTMYLRERERGREGEREREGGRERESRVWSKVRAISLLLVITL